MIEPVFREEWGRAVSILTRVTRSPSRRSGGLATGSRASERPRAWIVTTARNRASLRRLDRLDEAAAEYRNALALEMNAADRAFLEKRLAEVVASSP